MMTITKLLQLAWCMAYHQTRRGGCCATKMTTTRTTTRTTQRTTQRTTRRRRRMGTYGTEVKGNEEDNEEDDNEGKDNVFVLIGPHM